MYATCVRSLHPAQSNFMSGHRQVCSPSRRIHDGEHGRVHQNVPPQMHGISGKMTKFTPAKIRLPKPKAMIIQSATFVMSNTDAPQRAENLRKDVKSSATNAFAPHAQAYWPALPSPGVERAPPTRSNRMPWDAPPSAYPSVSSVQTGPRPFVSRGALSSPR